MNTAETVVTISESAVLAGALLAVAREAVKRPWIRFSVSVSFAILPADKRDPAPPRATTNPAGETAGASSASPAAPIGRVA